MSSKPRFQDESDQCEFLQQCQTERRNGRHSQAKEESKAGQVHVALAVELSCGVVGLGSDVLNASVVAGGLAFAHHLDHALDGIDKENSDKATSREGKSGGVEVNETSPGAETEKGRLALT